MICTICKERQSKTPGAKMCSRCYGKSWRSRFPDEWRAIARKSATKLRDKQMFGGKRLEILKRDNYCCSICGMTQEEHIEKYQKSLSIHHIDGRGTGVEIDKRNNNPENLATLCCKCHRVVEIQDNPKVVRRLPKGKWAMNFDVCVECHKNDSKHSTKGVCVRCSEAKRKDYKRIKQREYAVKWRKNKEFIEKELSISQLL